MKAVEALHFSGAFVEMCPSWPKQRLSHKSGPTVDRWYVYYAHVQAYCSLSPNEFSTKGLRAYGRSFFSGNGALKYTKIAFLPPYLNPFTTPSYYNRAGALSIALNNDIIAILYKILDIGSRSHFI